MVSRQRYRNAALARVPVVFLAPRSCGATALNCPAAHARHAYESEETSTGGKTVPLPKPVVYALPGLTEKKHGQFELLAAVNVPEWRVLNSVGASSFQLSSVTR